MKLAAGLKIVVTPNVAAVEENALRARANGTVFVPPWNVWVRGPLKKLPRAFHYVWRDNHEEGMAVAVYGAFTFDTANLSPRFATTRFPYEWAPTDLKGTHAWLETDAGLTFTQSLTEDTSNV